jgi:hypothetical protein
MKWELGWEGIEKTLNHTPSKYYTAIEYDFIMGVLWQQCFRGTVEEFITEKGLSELKELCHKELLLQDKISAPLPRTQENEFCDIRMGIGTFGWKYGLEVIEKALEKGCNFVDTSPMYGFGQVEKNLSNLNLDNVIFTVVSIRLNIFL